MLFRSRRPRGRDARGPREALRAAAGSLALHRDFPAAWRRVPFDRDGAIDALLEQLAELGALAARASSEDDYLARNLAEIARFVDEVRHVEAVRGRDHDGLEAELRNLARSRLVHWRWRGSPRRAYAPGLPREEVIARRDAAKERLDAFLADSDADLVRGLIGILQRVFSGQSARAILAFDVEEFFRKLGLDQHLTLGRRTGLAGMVQRIKAEASRLSQSE